MNHIVAEGLLLRGGVTQVSQAVATDGYNGARIHVWLIRSTGSLISGGLNLDLEGSMDLDNWVAPSLGFNVSVFDEPPLNEWVPSSGGAPAVNFPFIRVRYRNDTTEDILLGASVVLYNRA